LTISERLGSTAVEGQPTPEMLRLAIELADDARSFVRPRFRSRMSIEEKADGTPVTEVDVALEARLRDQIRLRFPEHGIIGEEAGSLRADAEWVWVLDPIDGTQSFILGKPTFATLIGLMHRGDPVLGVIEHPALGDRWIGAAGTHTLFNGAPTRVRPCAGMAGAALSTTGPNWFGADELAAFDRVRRAAKVQHWGGDCHSFGLLASGFIDLVIESSHRLHDFCALVPVIEGAGGIMTDWAGRRLGSESGPRVIAAGDRRTHGEALALLGEGKSW
jgi:inositol-phosphate phosphatase/L-galactose 1-phosphate phosphatase/histidinol-phosphatase